MIFVLTIVVLVFLGVVLFCPGILERFSARNSYHAKKKLVEKYVLPNVPGDAIKILDLGSGDGYIAHHLEQMGGKQVVKVDVIDTNLVGEKPIIYDGQKLPFEDKSFDLVLCCYVLHHAPNQKDLLKEMKRVSRYVLVIEDTPVLRIDWGLSWVHSHSSHGKCDKCFHGIDEWGKIFKRCGLVMVKKEKIPRTVFLIYPIQRCLFLLTS